MPVGEVRKRGAGELAVVGEAGKPDARSRTRCGSATWGSARCEWARCE